MVSDSKIHFRESRFSENRHAIAHSIAAPNGVWMDSITQVYVYMGNPKTNDIPENSDSYNDSYESYIIKIIDYP